LGKGYRPSHPAKPLRNHFSGFAKSSGNGAGYSLSLFPRRGDCENDYAQNHCPRSRRRPASRTIFTAGFQSRLCPSHRGVLFIAQTTLTVFWPAGSLVVSYRPSGLREPANRCRLRFRKYASAVLGWPRVDRRAPTIAAVSVVSAVLNNSICAVACFSRPAIADLSHGLPIQKPGDKAQALFHHRTRLPRHLHLPQNKSGRGAHVFCQLCLGPLTCPTRIRCHSRAAGLLVVVGVQRAGPPLELRPSSQFSVRERSAFHYRGLS
jgi:hypothetical protein